MSNPKFLPVKIPGNIITLYSQIQGPKDVKTLKMILDTGASYTMIPQRKALEIGYDPVVSEKRIQIFTVSGIEYVPMIQLAFLNLLGLKSKILMSSAMICPLKVPQTDCWD